METNDEHKTGESRDDAVVEALISPGESSFLDALLALAEETAERKGPQAALAGGLQAALARKMRAAMAQDGDARDAA